MRSHIDGRFLDGELVLIFGGVFAPDAGYAVDVRSGEIYRNGELVGWAQSLSYDRDALGWWVHYRAIPLGPLDHQTRGPRKRRGKATNREGSQRGRTEAP
jgi:hypothetical protein